MMAEFIVYMAEFIVYKRITDEETYYCRKRRSLIAVLKGMWFQSVTK